MLFCFPGKYHKIVCELFQINSNLTVLSILEWIVFYRDINSSDGNCRYHNNSCHLSGIDSYGYFIMLVN